MRNGHEFRRHVGRGLTEQPGAAEAADADGGEDPPHGHLRRVVGVLRPGPHSRGDEGALVCGVGAEGELLEVSDDLDHEAQRPRSGQGKVHAVKGESRPRCRDRVRRERGNKDPHGLERPGDKEATRVGHDLLETLVVSIPHDPEHQERAEAKRPDQYHPGRKHRPRARPAVVGQERKQGAKDKPGRAQGIVELLRLERVRNCKPRPAVPSRGAAEWGRSSERR